MGRIRRQVMMFMVPTSVRALGTNNLSGRAVTPIYINPQTFNISEAKIISKQLTKGGYVIQYWGEELPRIQASGTTGSAGIEGINVLREIYRHEQRQFRRVLKDRADQFAAEAQAALADTPQVGAGISLVLDTITAGGFTDITDGVSSTLEAIQNVFEGTSSASRQLELIPTLASFAVSIDVYFQGEKFRGYFTDFQVSENAQSPGLFDYTFNFEVLKRTGKRSNFMPWHREPMGPGGNARPASIPIAGQKLNELSFPSDAATTQEQIVGGKTVSTQERAAQDATQVDRNNVGVNKFSKLG